MVDLSSMFSKRILMVTMTVYIAAKGLLGRFSAMLRFLPASLFLLAAAGWRFHIYAISPGRRTPCTSLGIMLTLFDGGTFARRTCCRCAYRAYSFCAPGTCAGDICT